MTSGRKEYYAVFRGRCIEKPTIFSSWGDTHPRIIGFSGVQYKGFKTLEEARSYMRAHGEENPREVIKIGAGQSIPSGGKGFFAVAHGKRPGVYPNYDNKDGSKKEVDKEKGSCHGKFRTEEQANAFIEDWKAAYLQIVCEMTRVALDRNDRPRGIQDLGFQELEQFIGQLLLQPVKDPKVEIGYSCA